MLPASVVYVFLASELAVSLLHEVDSNEAHRPNCSHFQTSFKGPVMPSELSRIAEKEEDECRSCNNVCPALGPCKGCQQDRCDPEMVSRIWQSVPNNLRLRPNEMVDPFFNKDTVLLMVGDSILKQQYRALRHVLLESTRVTEITSKYRRRLHGKDADFHAYQNQDNWLTTFVTNTTWTFSDMHRNILDERLEEIMTPGTRHPRHPRAQRIVVYFDIGAHYNMNDARMYERELLNMFRHSKELVRHLQSKWHIRVQLIIQEPNAQHFENGDYHDGDQWCEPVCSQNTSPNERLVSFRNVLNGLGHAARSHFDVLDAYRVTSPLYFAHSSPVGRCPEAPNDCTHYCHAVWYFWVAALSRSGLLEA